MYRRLESKPIKIEAQDAKTDADCVCTCGSEKAIDGEKKPEANTALNQMAAHIKING